MRDITKIVPVIDGRRGSGRRECEKAAAALMATGLLFYRPAKQVAPEVESDIFDLFGRYFRQPQREKQRHSRPKIYYQSGWTPSNRELPVPRPRLIAKLKPKHRPHPTNGRKDNKERWFQATGTTPKKTRFPEFSAKRAIVPKAFEQEWMTKIQRWNDYALVAAEEVATMVARGLGLAPDAFTRLMKNAPHLFAPTGSNLDKYGTPGTILAGFHNDLNAITVHSKSNFPGLRVWLRSGEAVWVRVPEGCLLIQAGQQLEHATGGAILAGWHEVVSVPEMERGIIEARRRGLVPWRISMTLFAHFASNEMLEPLGRFATPAARRRYKRMFVGTQVKRELKKIALAHAA